METQILEGRRIKVNSKQEITVRFDERHDMVPFVTTLIEGDDVGNVISYIVSVTQRKAKIQFSSQFSGYLHLQAFSKVIP